MVDFSGSEKIEFFEDFNKAALNQLLYVKVIKPRSTTMLAVEDSSTITNICKAKVYPGWKIKSKFRVILTCQEKQLQKKQIYGDIQRQRELGMYFRNVASL